MKRLVIFAIAATMLASCSKDTTVDMLPTDDSKIYASIENEESRVQLQNLHTVWNAGDRIVVHSPNDLTLWSFNGKTGDRKGSFSKVGYFNVNASSLAIFDKYYALYSYDNYFNFGTVGSKPAIIMTAPSTQTYLKDSYGLHANTMLGTSNDGVNYTFKNIHGYLRLSLTGDKVVSKIELCGNKSEILAGEFYFTTDNPDKHYWYQSQTSTITLDCGSGVALSDTPTNFYFVVPPITFTDGILVNIHFSNGDVYPKATSKPITITRNTIQPMATIPTDGNVQWKYIYIHHTGDEIIVPKIPNGAPSAVTVNWGDGNTTLLGDISRRYYYLDGAASHVISIKTAETTLFEMDSCEGISKIDLSNF